jgi:hypothetical protein
MGETTSCLVVDDELACPRPETTVPEPSVVLLLLLAGVCAWQWWKGRGR